MEQVTIMQFTDPMMGLSWECEPALRKVEARFGKHVRIEACMGVLVRDVADFMTAQEHAMEPAEGIAAYNRRLARIYLDEEPLAGMPIVMDGFELFGLERRSSQPLCLAYEAAKLTAPKATGRFLYRLRYATVVECRPTTKRRELLRVADLAGLDPAAFAAQLDGAAARDALLHDQQLRAQLGTWQLPAFVISSGQDAVLLRGVPSYDAFERAIRELTGPEPQPAQNHVSEHALVSFLTAHPLVSSLEIASAFGLPECIAPTDLKLPSGTEIVYVKDAWFATTRRHA